MHHYSVTLINARIKNPPLHPYNPLRPLFPPFSSVWNNGVIENKHSTDVESSPPLPHVCMSIHPDVKTCSTAFWVLVPNDTPAWCSFANSRRWLRSLSRARYGGAS